MDNDIPEDSKVIVYYKSPSGNLSIWDGVYKDCPFDTSNSDWYLLDNCEQADVIIINYEN